ncbi:DUF3775 domain-containing protein [Legionella rowbothamii]|uniref:DUF3775 domain-containing protein n=1 Tax=Legionella rowbothamii TaxID=96229 RepID=UPI0010550DBC|nr:DUF3775 domain-containing protein [Legionella rowbothamii]
MLNLDTDMICNILDKMRQFQAKEEVSFPEVTDDMDAYYVLADYKNDAVYDEAVNIINNLRPDQQVTLVALMYLGREDFDVSEWDNAIEFASQELTNHTGQYLLSRPLVADYIENALNLLGLSCSE